MSECKPSIILNILSSLNQNNMTYYPFEWQLRRGSNLKKNRYISELKINDEWSLMCLWYTYDKHLYMPDYLEIHRNSKFGDIMVSGNFKLMRGQNCLLQRKFIQLIEDGHSTTQVELYSGSANHTFSIIGSLTIPARVELKECDKEIDFRSLLELSCNLEGLLDTKASYFSDVNLTCGTASFSVHKNILSVRSPVFYTMFKTEMKENIENKVNISDISPHVLKTMLTYIYTGKTGELSVQFAAELLFAADLYQLQDLKRVCTDYLRSQVSIENVLKTLVLGYLHDDDLKVFAMDFICNTREEFEIIEKTEEWEKLREKIPCLAMDVLIRLVKSKEERLRSYQLNAV